MGETTIRRSHATDQLATESGRRPHKDVNIGGRAADRIQDPHMAEDNRRKPLHRRPTADGRFPLGADEHEVAHPRRAEPDP